MAAKPRLLDVWLVEGDQVYTGVPFTVVADWLQQGRLLGTDHVRLSGNQKWHDIEAVPALAPYVPRAVPTEAHDEAEALQPIDLDVGWGSGHHDEEDDDVDMIPLIDISLVLLIFFMMSASVSVGIFSPIDTPPATHQLMEISKDSYWLGIDVRSRSGQVEKADDGKLLPWFSLGKDTQEIVEPTRDAKEVIAALAKALQPLEGETKVRLKAERSLSIETIRDVTLELQELERALNRARKGRPPLRFLIQGEVSEPQGK